MNSKKVTAPLFRDPIYDGAADPTVIWNHVEKEWWMVYMNRRATSRRMDVSWVHGTDLGIATSKEGNQWLYCGIIEDLDIEKGRNTFWAPEIIYHEGIYHMYVSYIKGVPDSWSGHKRHILHYTSDNLWNWIYQSTLSLSSGYVIDAAVHKLPNGKWRMWYKDEQNHSHTYAADSDDLYHWESVGPVIIGFPHEGANVFFWQEQYWLIIDEWSGQGVYQSKDCVNWQRNSKILDKDGIRKDDQGVGLHADVLVVNDKAYIFYFTHPDRAKGYGKDSYLSKRSSIQVAELEIENGILTCHRDKNLILHLS
ncbi:glycosyl hydrolase [Gracilibacillus salitolerans]|uniref:Glycosyl hydrolase n=1 Tax=Gracilibacillus salitolerans TaxID=2663022 RepID=A0A5Q2TKX7_9BACI|nr:glycosyl hydrolase [Gracilibacillus salitolerans]QGH33938.1 glycosyl hydrolase [Gracilibacillus salitolerans]